MGSKKSRLGHNPLAGRARPPGGEQASESDAPGMDVLIPPKADTLQAAGEPEPAADIPSEPKVAATKGEDMPAPPAKEANVAEITTGSEAPVEAKQAPESKEPRNFTPSNALGPDLDELEGVVDRRHQYLGFVLAGAPYAVEVERVREVVPCDELTALPSLPSFVRGVMNVRGSAVPILDLRRRFGMGAAVETKKTCVLITEFRRGTKTRTFGAIVDQVDGVYEFGAGDLEPVPALGYGEYRHFFSAVGKDDHQLVPIVDVTQIFADAAG